MYYKVCGLILRFFMLFIFRIKYVGRNNMPSDGGCILAVNHRHNWDPIIAALASPRQLTFMAKAELFKNPVFGRLIKSLGAFPINRNSGDVGAVKSAFKILKENRVMLIFPQGHRIKDGSKGKTRAGMVRVAQMCKVPIIPMYISGEYRWMNKITVTIGEPIYLTEYYGKKLSEEELNNIKDDIIDIMWSYKVD